MDFPKEEEEEEKDSDEEWKDDIDETRMRRKMCMAWILASKEFSKLKIQLKDRDEEDGNERTILSRERRAELRRAWGEFSADEQLRVGWKASEKELLGEISLVVLMKKAKELEQSYAMKQQQLKETTQEKKVPQDTELRMTNKNYLEFRDMWIAIHSCWAGAFEYISKFPLIKLLLLALCSNH